MIEGPGFEFRQERLQNFLLQCQPSVLTLILVFVPPPCYRSSTYKILVILPKVQMAGYSYQIYHLIRYSCFSYSQEISNLASSPNYENKIDHPRLSEYVGEHLGDTSR